VNRKQVRLYALEVVSAMIWQECKSPTGLTIPGEGGMFDEYGCKDEDQSKVYDALEEIRAEIRRKIERTN
jgi:hypothetical protein